jgi:predicted hydrolase (HD superfamily)
MSLQLNRTSFGNPSNKGNTLSRADAEILFNEWVINLRLQLHMKQVAYLMKCWAAEKEHLDEAGQWKWELAGLLHDADWDQWPDQHCKKIIEELEHRNVDPEIIHAMLHTALIILVLNLKRKWIRCYTLLMNYQD